MSTSFPRNLFQGITFSLALVIGSASIGMAQPPQGNKAPMMQQNKKAKKDYSKKEMKSFVDAQQVVINVQMQNKQKMQDAIASTEGIDLPTFKKIAQSKRKQQGRGQRAGASGMPQSGGAASNFNNEQMAAFDKASSKVMKIQQGMQQSLMKKIPEQTGMEFVKFQQMAMAIRQSPEMQSKVRKMMKAGKGQKGQMQQAPKAK